MGTIEVLKNVQRIALECMIGKKPVHIIGKCDARDIKPTGVCSEQGS